MAVVNPNYAKLAAGYLFPEINRRVKTFEEITGKRAIRLGIGDTTEPLTPHVVAAMTEAVQKLGNVKTYKGYGPEQGYLDLRESIAKVYADRKISINTGEIFVGDGAKSDVANIQSIFGTNARIAIQDPSYPVYVDTNVIAGRTGEFDTVRNQYNGLIYMLCNEDNKFIPQIPTFNNSSDAKFLIGGDNQIKTDLIYLCSPNNPTGAVMDRKSLESFVNYAKHNKSVILFDAAYNWFIKDPELPQSIYEIEGAKECAIEFNSFSKLAGFTSSRLGWTVVPNKLVAENVEPGIINGIWNGRQTRFFNGANIIAQAGGVAALSSQGRKESQELLIDHYMGNARIIRSALQEIGIKTFGGDNAPYIWMKNPNNMDSWKFFDKMLDETQVVTTPGVGFGPAGQGFTRVSAFGHRENVEAAMESIKQNLKI